MRALVLFLSIASTAQAAAKWTVLSYFAADNNLEKDMVGNVVEMSKVGSNADLNIVVQLDRGYQNADAMMASFPGAAYYSGVKRFLIQKDNAMEVGSLGDIDMRQPQTLTDFIKWGVQTYPADKYILILSDHGGAWTGCCNDESLGPQAMDLASITAGINGGGIVFDVIGFDECLMANLEVAWALQNSGKVLVASEEIEPGPGWDWTAWMGALAANPALDGIGIGKVIADGFKANIEAKAPNQAHIITLSVTDLTQIPALGAAASKLAEALLPSAVDLPKWRPLAQARNASYVFGAQGQGDEGLTIDLGLFASTVAGTAGSASAELMTALDAAVKYKVSGTKFSKAGGLSIYLPLKNVNGAYGTIDFPRSTKWGALVAAYAIQAASDNTPPQVSLTVTPMSGGRATVSTQSSDGDLAQINTVLAAWRRHLPRRAADDRDVRRHLAGALRRHHQCFCAHVRHRRGRRRHAGRQHPRRRRRRRQRQLRAGAGAYGDRPRHQDGDTGGRLRLLRRRGRRDRPRERRCPGAPAQGDGHGRQLQRRPRRRHAPGRGPDRQAAAGARHRAARRPRLRPRRQRHGGAGLGDDGRHGEHGRHERRRRLRRRGLLGQRGGGAAGAVAAADHGCPWSRQSETPRQPSASWPEGPGRSLTTSCTRPTGNSGCLSLIPGGSDARSNPGSTSSTSGTH
jgi:hypothetical protein